MSDQVITVRRAIFFGPYRGPARNRPMIFSLPVYGWFTEGFDTLDLKEAKTLLEELAA